MSIFTRYAALVVAVLFSSVVQAAPVTFNFVFSGASLTPPNTTVITGSITYDGTQVNNPGTTGGFNSVTGVLALDVTVSGATAGNGHFTLSDFHGVLFTNNGTSALNFSNSLIGQNVGGTLIWGPLPAGSAGDFNLFGTGNAPVGMAPFALCANGGQAEGSCASLVSMTPPVATPAPTLGVWMLALLGLILAGTTLWTMQRNR